MGNLELYEQLLGLPYLKVHGVRVEKDRINISCELKEASAKCPNCSSLSGHVHQRYERRLRDLNIAAREVYLILRVRQFHCKHCKRYFTEGIDFADPNKSHTYRQEDFMFAVASKQSYAESAVILNAHPKTVERVVLSHCERRAGVSARYAAVRRLGIDEQSHRKGKKDYVCVLTDLDRGTLVDVLKSRKKEDLIAHFQSLGSDFCEQITDVSCDYWQGYISAAQACFPNARIVLDRFHVTKLLNDCLDTFRKSLRKSDPKNTNYRRLKWILYKQYHRMSDTELDDLGRCFRDCPGLEEIYWTRERFHHILDNSLRAQEAACQLDAWAESMSQEAGCVFEPFIKTLKNTKEYIANYVENHLSNAVTEGLNNLIRSIKRVAFGMPNFEHLRLRALAISG